MASLPIDIPSCPDSREGPRHVAVPPRSADDVVDRLLALAERVVGIPWLAIASLDADGDLAVRPRRRAAPDGFPAPSSILRSLWELTVRSYAPLVIDDTREFIDSAESRLPEIAAYLGVPLVLTDGEVLGALVALATYPHSWRGDDVAIMREVADLVAVELERHLPTWAAGDETVPSPAMLPQPGGDAARPAPGISEIGFSSRARLFADIEQALQRDRRVALLLIDIDNFKAVNETLGYEIGDHVLRQVEQRIRAHLREHDLAICLGGDEFAVLLQDTGEEHDAVQAARRLVEALRAPLLVGDRYVFVTCSVGIVSALPGSSGPEALLRSGDIAMNRAKRLGGNGYQVFDPLIGAAALQRLEMTHDLRRAVERREFIVHYQPKVLLRTGDVTAVEALVRWQHPQRGLLPPSTFVGLAEETGLILQIGEFVLVEACAQLRRWQVAGVAADGLSVSVNLSPRQFTQPDLVGHIARALEASGLSPKCLLLEITESVALDDVEATIRTLNELKQLGVRLAMDDFGTGYSSLSQLQRLPIDILKIDRSLVANVGTSMRDTVIMSVIISLARALGVDVVAEGIENDDQLASLLMLECEMAQGFRFARPLPPDGVEQLLRDAEPTWLRQPALPEFPDVLR